MKVRNAFAVSAVATLSLALGIEVARSCTEHVAGAASARLEYAPVAWWTAAAQTQPPAAAGVPSWSALAAAPASALRPLAPVAPRRRVQVLAHVNPGGGYSADVFAHGSYAYLSSWRSRTCPALGVRVYDLRNPRRPVRVSTFANAASDPAVTGTWTEKTIVQRVSTPSFSGVLAVTSFQACFAGAFQGFGVYDVTDPARPRRLALVATAPRGAHELWLGSARGRAYVYTAIPYAELESSPDYNPTTRTATIPGREAGFRIYDVSNPTAPVKVGEWNSWTAIGVHPNAGRGRFNRNFVHSVIVDSAAQRAYVSNWDLGTVILDVSQPASPRFVGRTTFPRSSEGDAHSAALAQGGKLLVETHETVGGIPTFWSLANLRAPRKLGALSVRSSDGARGDFRAFTTGVHDPKVLGRRAYFSWYRRGVVVADISRPAKPRTLAQFVPTPTADPYQEVCLGRCTMTWGVFATSKYVLASDIVSGLWVIRVR